MGKRILVLDDDQHISEIITFILLYGGYEVKSLPSGHEVVKVSGQYEPDLILMDVILAGLDGREICRTLKELVTTSHIPVILISASHDLADSANQSGAPYDFIPKPFDMDLLLAKVKQQLPS